MSNESKRTI